MSGQLVGEVLDARAERLADLSQAQTLALVAIAEKCHADSRQGSVRLSHIQAAIGKSQRTTVRTLEQLKDRELIRVVKRGYKSHGVARASIYELSALTPPKVAQPTSGAYATQDGATNGHVLTPNPDVLTPNPDVLTPSMGGVLDGSIDGSIDGREARACASGEPLDVETVPDPGNALSLISNLSEQQNNVIDAELVDNEPDDPEPDRHCATHMPYGTSKSCRACKVARLNHEAWSARQSERLLLQLRAATAARRDKPAEQPKPQHRCPWCKDGGLVLDSTGAQMLYVCHHDGRRSEATPTELAELKRRQEKNNPEGITP
jgi:DNA-binding transcriptional ArsR family regulator